MDSVTTLFDVSLLKEENVSRTLKEVYDSLKERGYNPVNQIVGYIISGDPGYISSYQNARKKMMSLDRSELTAIILESYLKNH